MFRSRGGQCCNVREQEEVCCRWWVFALCCLSRLFACYLYRLPVMLVPRGFRRVDVAIAPVIGRLVLEMSLYSLYYSRIRGKCIRAYTSNENPEMDMNLIIATKARDSVDFIESCYSRTIRSPAKTQRAHCVLIFQSQRKYPKPEASTNLCAGRLSQRLCTLPLCTLLPLLEWCCI